MNMKMLITLVVQGALATTAIPGLVVAQGTTQVITAVDVDTLGAGLRSSRIVGSAVVNENRDTIGKIDDLIISRDSPGVFAVLSFGGFLGMGSKLVAVKFSELQPTTDNNGFVLAGATKESLKALPDFKYRE
jgi:hypothetical protein